MRKGWWCAVSVVGLVAIAPTQSQAQDTGALKAEAESFGKDVLKHFFGPNWQIGVHGGANTYGRMLLQRTDRRLIFEGQRELRGGTGWDAGVSAGVDFLLRMGFQMDYTFSRTDLGWHTDDGDGSEILDRSDMGTLKSHQASFQVRRYMLPPSVVKFTPYASVGLLTTWWVLGDQDDLLEPLDDVILAAGGTTQFRWGGIGTFGLQGKLAKHWAVRAEAVRMTSGNPFTGKDSYIAASGSQTLFETIDEPTRVSKTDYRLAVVYSFGRPALKTPAANK